MKLLNLLGRLRGTRVLKIIITWDNEAGVFMATSRDVPGLVTEADSIPAMIRKLEVMVPELMELHAGNKPEHHVPVELLVKKTTICAAY